MNKYDIAREVFEEIRDRPYRAALYPNKAQNCFFKGVELIEQLTTIGFAMHARIGEVDWSDTPCPEDIVKLVPEGSLETHFYPEIYMGGDWKILDPSWNKSFAQKFDVPFSEFGEGNQSCFLIKKLYTPEEQAQYVLNWKKARNDDEKNNDQSYAKTYSPFINALNNWLEKENPCH